MPQQSVAEEFREAVAKSPGTHFESLTRTRTLHRLDRIPFLGAPVFFNASERQRIAEILTVITSAIERIGDLYYAGEMLPGARPFRYHIPLSDRVVELCQLDSVHSPRLCVSRYDVAANPDTGEFQILEINPGDPSALGYHDVALDGLLTSPITMAISNRHHIRTDHLLPLHRQALVEALPTPPQSPSQPTLAFAVAKESPVLDDHDVMAQAARDVGYRATVGDPRDFEWDGRKLRLGSVAIDAVWRDIIDEFALDPYWDATLAFRTAYGQRAFALRNHFSVAFADCKGLFDILSDERNACLFDGEQNRILRAHIPWTRLLVEGRTVYDGREVDLIELVRERREHFVLKPNIGCCGYNVLIGCECSQKDWDARIAAAVAMPGSDIVQRYCPLPTGFFPTTSGGYDELPFVSSFWQFGGHSTGEFTGSFVRASKSRVINIFHQGDGLFTVNGGISTIFWVD